MLVVVVTAAAAAAAAAVEGKRVVVLEGVEGVEEVVVELYLGCDHGAAVEHGLPVGLECAQLGKGHGVYAVDRAAVAGLLKVRVIT